MKFTREAHRWVYFCLCVCMRVCVQMAIHMCGCLSVYGGGCRYAHRCVCVQWRQVCMHMKMVWGGQRALQMELPGSTRVTSHSQIKFPRNAKQTKHFSDFPISLLLLCSLLAKQGKKRLNLKWVFQSLGFTQHLKTEQKKGKLRNLSNTSEEFEKNLHREFLLKI